jgi:hypothetical protein
MRETVRSLFESSLSLSPTRPHTKTTIDPCLANLSPEGPPKKVRHPISPEKVPPIPAVEETFDDVVLEVVAEPEPESGVDARIMIDLMEKHQEEVARLQGELRRIDVERSRAETEAQAATGILTQTERRLRDIEAELRDERTRYDVAMQRSQLMEQANSLPWWRWTMRKEFMRRAQSLTMALPAR